MRAGMISAAPENSSANGDSAASFARVPSFVWHAQVCKYNDMFLFYEQSFEGQKLP